ncbi:MAG: DUF192 domain-containing protein [Snowella sp.]|nr:DUF192 domain-containing protein [Snowella sp.]
MQRQKMAYGIVAVLLLWGCVNSELSLSQPQAALSQAQMLPIGAIAKVEQNVIQLEVAKTPEEQAMGLMFRTHLEKDRGMIFLFSPPRITRFWMKNTLIPLDMIFLRDGVIQSISPKVPPCKSDPCPSYGPFVEIDQVIELASGRAAELGLKRGDRLHIEFLKTP